MTVPRNEVIVGDAVAALQALPAAFAQTCVTSFPYWGLRDYGVHDDPAAVGLEATLDDHLDNCVRLGRAVRRSLRPDGTLWLNYGDAYAGTGGPQNHSNRHNLLANGPGEATREKRAKDHGMPVKRPKSGFKPKDLMGLAWRVAFALQEDGWWLRSDIVWHKPNAMPESVHDRPARAHEYVFLLARSERYFYDAEAVKVKASEATKARRAMAWVPKGDASREAVGRTWPAIGGKHAGGRPQLVRAVQIARKAGLTKAHLEAVAQCGITDTGKALVLTQNGAGKSDPSAMALAAEAKKVLKGYYRELIGLQGRAIIKAWDAPTQRGGPESAGPMQVTTARLKEGRGRGDFNESSDAQVLPVRNLRDVWSILSQPYGEAHFATFPEALVDPCIKAGTSQAGQCPACGAAWRRDVERQAYGDWNPRKVGDGLVKRTSGSNTWRDGAYVPPVTRGWAPACDCEAGDPVPQIVLDPCFGSGTVGLVAKRLGRDFLGTEINPEYADMARRRLSPVMNQRLDAYKETKT